MREILFGRYAAIFAFAWLCLARVARAEEPKRGEAERAFSAGEQAYGAGQYLIAARAYENAYELQPLPEITFSIAQAYRRHFFADSDVQWLEKAKTFYQRYLEEQPKDGRRAHAITHLGNIALLLAARAQQDPSGEQAPALPRTELLISSTTPGAMAAIDGAPADKVPVVQIVTPGSHRVQVFAPGYFESDQQLLALEGRLSIVATELKPQPGLLQVSAPPGSDIWLDGKRIGQAPLGKPLSLQDGPHTVGVSAAGRRPATRRVTMDRGEEQSLRFELETSSQRTAAYWTFAGAGAFAVGGTVMAILAAVAEAQTEDARASLADGRALTPSEAAASNDALGRRDLFRALSFTGFGVAGVAGVTGTLIVVFDNPVPDGQPAGEVSTFGLGYRGTF